MAGCTAPAPPKKVMKTAGLAADPPSGSPVAQSDWRDWANLTEGAAGQIAERLLADDVADYLCFRAACRSWRRSTACPHARDGLDRRFHPRRWVMLPLMTSSGGVRRELLNITTGARVHVDLPELRHQHVLGPTSGGLLVICDKRTLAMRLLNPLTRHLTAGLPDATSLLHTSAALTRQQQQELLRYRLQSARLHSAGLANGEDSTVVLHFHTSWLVVAKPGDKRWRQLSGSNGFVVTALSFAGRFFCVTENAIAAVDTAAEDPQLVPVAQLQLGVELRPYDGTVKLVDNDGELILVHRKWMGNSNIPRPGYEVHRVDLEAGNTVPMPGLSGRALFVGQGPRGCRPAISVPAGLSSCIRADTVYTCRDFCRLDRVPEIIARPAQYIPGILCSGIRQDARECSVVHSMSRYICYSEIIVSPPPRSQRVAVRGRHLLSSITTRS
ncbi:uncharacterized protein LOC106865837 [Brachypodium distachyon]|uniref:KIB1-4 beta-propeller domain-containing protein n=1 Tax=Brachypodium distachyon TaxID=15368 RepID=I1GT76_BRADI|nr:uncharacterized protein LOC106865837 [Brachypodium distachyon]KQK15623.2 hypothetical protein BRADI_1g24020v3 [Brachypodium distachyon]|eukprot:XP_014752243.1 uncharacterized protein LOC106865837 [Brachypodium distachyon]